MPQVILGIFITIFTCKSVVEIPYYITKHPPRIEMVIKNSNGTYFFLFIIFIIEICMDVNDHWRWANHLHQF